jgi:uncharacterized membrane protein
MSKGRLEALTDGIFATVMTVLVLSLSVPVITSAETISQIVDGLAPIIYGYLLSFLMLAVFWVRHHSVFHFINRVDSSFLWLNLIFLLTIGFIPFSTELLGRFSTEEEAALIYGANLFVTGLCLQMLWRYALRWKLVNPDGMDEKMMGIINRRLTWGPVLYLLAMAISFVSPVISESIYAGTLVYYVFASSLGLHIRRAMNSQRNH